MTIKNQFYFPLNLIINKPWKIISIVSFIGLFAILNHAMWRDEMNTWLIVRDSESFFQMVKNVNYQGHPLLWGMGVFLVRNIRPLAKPRETVILTAREESLRYFATLRFAQYDIIAITTFARGLLLIIL